MRVKKLEEKSLIKNLKAKNEEAFKILVEKYKDLVYSTIIPIIQNIDDADDLTQEVFIQIYKSIKNFKEKSSISTWIYKISISKAYEHLRYKKRKKRFSILVNIFREDDSLIDIPNFHHPGIQLEQKENAKILFDAIEKLPDNQKKAYILKNIQGLSYKKISDIMEKSVASVESILFRAKNNLKNILGKKTKGTRNN
jgi:RNA polymerase sigma factor (sigma-70 family)|tara:strand:+ start:760 stop:1350 length:591 start_codon:yes stop_codon:yes gene_type:complete